MATIGFSFNSLVDYVKSLLSSKADKTALDNHMHDYKNPHLVTAEEAGARPDTWTPSAADVGAVSKAGDSMSGGLEAPFVKTSGSDAIRLTPDADNTPSFISFNKPTGVRKAYFGYGSGANPTLTINNESSNGSLDIITSGIVTFNSKSADFKGDLVFRKNVYVEGKSTSNSYTTLANAYANFTLQGNSGKKVLLEYEADTGNTSVIHRLDTGANLNVWQFMNNGDFISPANIIAYSDAKLKTDLEVIPNALSKVMQLSGYNYTRIDSGARQTGVVAQEVQAVLPEAVSVVKDDGTLGVAYGNMVGLLIEAIKELKHKVEALECKSQN